MISKIRSLKNGLFEKTLKKSLVRVLKQQFFMSALRKKVCFFIFHSHFFHCAGGKAFKA